MEDQKNPETRTRRHSQSVYIGKAGKERSQELLDALYILLDSTPWRGIKITDVTSVAGCSTGLFYDYFSSLEDAFDVLWERLSHTSNRKPGHIVAVHGLVEYEKTMKVKVRK